MPDKKESSPGENAPQRSSEHPDLRLLRRFPETKITAVLVFKDLLNPLSFDLLADVPTGGTPFVSSLSDSLQIGVITPRVDKKTHGTGLKVDGMLPEDRGKRVVVVDDLVTHAESKIEVINVLENEGIHVKDVVVLIDREQGGREQLEKAGYTLHSAITLSQMLNFYARNSILAPEAFEMVKEQIAASNAYLRRERNQN